MNMDVFKKHIGEVFDGRYKICRTIGVGGMAIVYEARDLVTGQRVAVKMLKDSISDNPQALRRFVNESKAVAMLNHPNIVKILDLSVKTEHKFIVMEYIKGITLREYMTSKGKLTWRESSAFIAQILLALDHAHMKGVVHRDIKPQNIMVMEGGVIKVTDFGIAKIPDAETVTMVDHAVGTIYYISPEQARGKKIDNRSDIYSLGVMFYEMVTGRLPFLAENSYGIMHKQIHDAPQRPTKWTPELPLGVEQIILQAMEKQPQNRYQSASQMLRHVYRIQRNPTIIFQKQTPAPRTPTAEVAINRTKESSERYPDQNRRSTAPQQTKNTQAVTRPSAAKPMPQKNARTQQATKMTPEPAAITFKSRKQPAKPSKPQPKRKKEYVVSFPVVIGILIAFLILAAIGFIGLFSALFANTETAPAYSYESYEAMVEVTEAPTHSPQIFSEMERL